MKALLWQIDDEYKQDTRKGQSKQRAPIQRLCVQCGDLPARDVQIANAPRASRLPGLFLYALWPVHLADLIRRRGSAGTPDDTAPGGEPGLAKDPPSGGQDAPRAAAF